MSGQEASLELTTGVCFQSNIHWTAHHEIYHVLHLLNYPSCVLLYSPSSELPAVDLPFLPFTLAAMLLLAFKIEKVCNSDSLKLTVELHEA